MRKILRTIYLDKRVVDKICRLSTKTRVPQAVFIREGIDLMLKKHQKQLSSKQKKGKTQNYLFDKRKILKMVPKLRKVKKGSK